MKLRPPTGPLCAKLAVAFLCTGSAGLAQDSSSNDVSALKAQMQKMQLENQAQMQKLQSENQTHMQRMEKEYEDRITSMESEMKSLESKADTGTGSEHR